MRTKPKSASPYRKKKSHTRPHELCAKIVLKSIIVPSEAIRMLIIM